MKFTAVFHFMSFKTITKLSLGDGTIDALLVSNLNLNCVGGDFVGATVSRGRLCRGRHCKRASLYTEWATS